MAIRIEYQASPGLVGMAAYAAGAGKRRREDSQKMMDRMWEQARENRRWQQAVGMRRDEQAFRLREAQQGMQNDQRVALLRSQQAANAEAVKAGVALPYPDAASGVMPSLPQVGQQRMTVQEGGGRFAITGPGAAGGGAPAAAGVPVAGQGNPLEELIAVNARARDAKLAEPELNRQFQREQEDRRAENNRLRDIAKAEYQSTASRVKSLYDEANEKRQWFDRPLTPTGMEVANKLRKRWNDIHSQQKKERNPDEYASQLAQFNQEVDDARFDTKIQMEPGIEERAGKDYLPIGPDGKTLPSLDGASSIFIRGKNGYTVQSIGNDAAKQASPFGLSSREYFSDPKRASTALTEARNALVMERGAEGSAPTQAEIQKRAEDDFSSKQKWIQGMQGGTTDGVPPKAAAPAATAVPSPVSASSVPAAQAPAMTKEDIVAALSAMEHRPFLTAEEKATAEELARQYDTAPAAAEVSSSATGYAKALGNIVDERKPTSSVDAAARMESLQQKQFWNDEDKSEFDRLRKKQWDAGSSQQPSGSALSMAQAAARSGDADAQAALRKRGIAW